MMKQILKSGLIFLSGVLAGAAGGFFIAKTICEKKCNEEVQSVIESFSQLQKDNQAKAEIAKNKPDILTVANALKATEEKEKVNDSMPLAPIPTPKTNYAKIPEEKNEESVPLPTEIVEEDKNDEFLNSTVAMNGPADPNANTAEPYILRRPPNENDEPFYTVITVMYYIDGTYADTRGTEMEIEDYIGRKMMDYVEKSKDDEIFIRNDELELDIDIVKDARTYDEVMFG